MEEKNVTTKMYMHGTALLNVHSFPVVGSDTQFPPRFLHQSLDVYETHNNAFTLQLTLREEEKEEVSNCADRRNLGGRGRVDIRGEGE
jgi:hypothetical protein